MNNPFGMMQQFRTFVDNFQKMQKDPRQTVQELLNSGQMSQAQFNELSQRANMILGKNPFGGKIN